MSYWLFVVAGVFGVFAVFAKRLNTTIITGPMVFVSAGLLIGADGLGVIEAEPSAEAVTLLLEMTLAIVLFTDATAINSTAWRQEAFVPGRLLVVGLPLAILLGTGVASGLFSELGVWEAALIATILAPTDASLGQAVISNRRVPQRIRQGLNVESGLNDGIALPLVIIFLGAAEESATGGSFGDVISFIGQEILVAAVVGLAIGWVGAKLLLVSTRRGWSSAMWTQIGAVTVAAAAYGLAVPLHGSGFIAAWVAGLTLGAITKGEVENLSEFAETLGTTLTMTSFLIFGAVLLGPAIGDLTWTIGLFAVLSLTLIRMIPVAVAMVGSKLGGPSVLFLGWFGPRGLASIIFAGIVIEDADLPAESTIVTVVIVTVGLSVFVHGASSWFGSESYADWYDGEEHADPDIPEAQGRLEPRARGQFGPRPPGRPGGKGERES
ncbi:MAG: cation:proton antiporter [Acidimicrobiales bacterium]